MLTIQNFSTKNRDRVIRNSLYRIFYDNDSNKWYIHEIYNNKKTFAGWSAFHDNDLQKVLDKFNNLTKEKERNKKLALLLAKYDLDLDCDWNDLLEELINKNKYLYLSYYLEKNRNDWNDGCTYAEIGLINFNIENELDQKIYDDIIHYIYNWGDYMDGRCFRDCKYNYSELYGIVAEQEPDLYKDFQVIMENIGNY